jgi:hypothetical protein
MKQNTSNQHSSGLNEQQLGMIRLLKKIPENDFLQIRKLAVKH